MSIEKTVKDENIILTEDGNPVAVLSGKLNGDTIELSLEGLLRADVETYLHNELKFYLASDIRKLIVNCAEITGITPGCFMELLSLKSGLICRNGEIEFENKSAALLEFEKRTGKKL